MKKFRNPVREKDRLFSNRQDSVRKYVERAFGVLQARFRIIDTSCKLWNSKDVRKVIIACIILHLMVVENERERHLCNDYLFDYDDYVEPIMRQRLSLPNDWVVQRSQIMQFTMQPYVFSTTVGSCRAHFETSLRQQQRY